MSSIMNTSFLVLVFMIVTEWLFDCQGTVSEMSWHIILSTMSWHLTPNSYISLYVHIVFSTKERQAMIGPDLQNRLWSYMGGIARENQMKAYCPSAECRITFMSFYRFPQPFQWQKRCNSLKAVPLNGFMTHLLTYRNLRGKKGMA